MTTDRKFFRATEESAARVRLVWGGATWPECLVQEWKLETDRKHSTEKLGFFHEHQQIGCGTLGDLCPGQWLFEG